MNWKMARFRASAVAAALAAGAGLASADTDLTWIAKLPGVSLPSQNTARPGPKTVYTLSGDMDATLASVRDGLTERRWAIAKGGAAPSGRAAATARIVVADKEGTRVKIVGRRAKGISNLTVTVVRGLGASGTAR